MRKTISHKPAPTTKAVIMASGSKWLSSPLAPKCIKHVVPYVPSQVTPAPRGSMLTMGKNRAMAKPLPTVFVATRGGTFATCSKYHSHPAVRMITGTVANNQAPAPRG